MVTGHIFRLRIGLSPITVVAKISLQSEETAGQWAMLKGHVDTKTVITIVRALMPS